MEINIKNKQCFIDGNYDAIIINNKTNISDFDVMFIPNQEKIDKNKNIDYFNILDKFDLSFKAVDIFVSKFLKENIIVGFIDNKKIQGYENEFFGVKTNDGKILYINVTNPVLMNIKKECQEKFYADCISLLNKNEINKFLIKDSNFLSYNISNINPDVMNKLMFTYNINKENLTEMDKRIIETVSSNVFLQNPDDLIIKFLNNEGVLIISNNEIIIKSSNTTKDIVTNLAFEEKKNRKLKNNR